MPALDNRQKGPNKKHEFVITADTSDEERSALLAQLKSLNLLGSNFGYSSFPPRFLESVLETGANRFTSTGTPKPEVFCCTHGWNDRNDETLVDNGDGTEIFFYLESHEDRDGNRALAVYHLARLRDTVAAGYTFVDGSPNPDALAAVLQFRVIPR